MPRGIRLIRRRTKAGTASPWTGLVTTCEGGVLPIVLLPQTVERVNYVILNRFSSVVFHFHSARAKCLIAYIVGTSQKHKLSLQIDPIPCTVFSPLFADWWRLFKVAGLWCAGMAAPLHVTVPSQIYSLLGCSSFLVLTCILYFISVQLQFFGKRMRPSPELLQFCERS